MPKYYVTSGELQVVLEAFDPMDAAYKALLSCQGHTIDERYFYIDERGFRSKWSNSNANCVKNSRKFAQHIIDYEDVYETYGTDNELD